MSNWDLMMPGMGLTAIGLAGLTLSYAGIAHTFIDGMHALTGLTMFVGLIFLAAGILDGGVSTSNRAKATTLVILSISLSFGMYALTMNTSNFVITLAGILMAITFPAVVFAYLAMKHPSAAKPVGAISAMASAAGIIMWVSFGIFSAPDTYMIPQEVSVEEPEEDITPSGPIFAIEILEDSTIEGNPDYKPDIATVPQGYTIQWTNADSIAHTVTSSEGFGELFDSSLMSMGDVFSLDTTELEIGEYEYVCTLHPYMIATIIIEEAKEPTKVTIPTGAAMPEDGQIYYDPEIIDVAIGTTIAWDNQDSTVHTVTSGDVPEADGMFDSEMMAAGDIYEYTFTEPGNYNYFCIYHPWMIGTVNVE
ncbi:cupredoxin domain-containing protein [archaeon]|nr:cupredoxin domain-containing protein [archaeon]